MDLSHNNLRRVKAVPIHARPLCEILKNLTIDIPPDAQPLCLGVDAQDPQRVYLYIHSEMFRELPEGALTPELCIRVKNEYVE